MDGNKDGVVTLSEFLEACRADPDISTSMAALDTAFWHSARPRYMPWTWKHSVDLEIYMNTNRSTLYLTSWTRGNKQFPQGVSQRRNLDERAERDYREDLPQVLFRARIFGIEERKISREKKKEKKKRRRYFFPPATTCSKTRFVKREWRLKDPKRRVVFFTGERIPSLSVDKRRPTLTIRERHLPKIGRNRS